VRLGLISDSVLQGIESPGAQIDQFCHDSVEILGEKLMSRWLRSFVFGFTILFAVASFSAAQQLYFTSESGQNIGLVNWPAGTVQTLLTTSGKPDSLVLNANGQIIYSMPSAGQVWLFDPSTGSNTMLAGGLKYPRDMVIEPGGQTMLIGFYSPGGIVRYNFATGAVTTLSKKLGNVDGLAYDANGDLFAVDGHNQVCQIDPVAGTVLKCIVLEPHHGVNGGDGMVYDSYTGQLWVSHDGQIGNGLIEIPTDLSSFTLYQTGHILVPDGLASDGQGNLYIGAGLRSIVQYNIPTDTIVKSVKAHGVDGCVLIPGTYASTKTPPSPSYNASALVQVEGSPKAPSLTPADERR